MLRSRTALLSLSRTTTVHRTVTVTIRVTDTRRHTSASQVINSSLRHHCLIYTLTLGAFEEKPNNEKRARTQRATMIRRQPTLIALNDTDVQDVRDFLERVKHEGNPGGFSQSPSHSQSLSQSQSQQAPPSTNASSASTAGTSASASAGSATSSATVAGGSAGVAGGSGSGSGGGNGNGAVRTKEERLGLR